MENFKNFTWDFFNKITVEGFGVVTSWLTQIPCNLYVKVYVRKNSLRLKFNLGYITKYLFKKWRNYKLKIIQFQKTGALHDAKENGLKKKKKTNKMK